MKHCIYRYPISYPGEFVIEAPAGTRFLSAGIKTYDSGVEELNVWAQVPIEGFPMILNHTISVFPTGGEGFGEDSYRYRFLNTVILKNGLVFHVFEKMLESRVPSPTAYNLQQDYDTRTSFN